MNLTYCTLTGVDEQTDLSLVVALSARHPLVEWGFLYSPKRHGQPGRYPSVEFLRGALADLPVHVNVALHVCGEGVSQLIKDDPTVLELVHLVGQRAGRIQLNFNAHAIGSKFTIEQVRSCIERHASIEFITQYNQANIHVWKLLIGCKNHSVLFDASGGRGIEVAQWDAPLPGVRCGYAGGLGPENLEQEILKIRVASTDAPVWIDMEGKLRDSSDRFDLDVVQRVLATIQAINAVDGLRSAIDYALENASTSEVLAMLTGSFVGLTTEVVRRQGLDANGEIRIDGGARRDVTIHSLKA